jgi:transcriptional regulator with XRE-family HTH domain
MTSLSEQFADLLRRSEGSEEYWLDIAISDFAQDLHARMRELGVTHKELAERMGTSRPYVTKLLSGGNFTLQTMVKLAMALDAVVRIRLQGREHRAVERETAGSGAVVPRFRLSLLNPRGEMVTFTDPSPIVVDVDLSEKTTMRTQNQFSGLPVGEPGKYTFHIEMAAEGGWRTVAQVPYLFLVQSDGAE